MRIVRTSLALGIVALLVAGGPILGGAHRVYAEIDDEVFVPPNVIPPPMQLGFLYGGTIGVGLTAPSSQSSQLYSFSTVNGQMLDLLDIGFDAGPSVVEAFDSLGLIAVAGLGTANGTQSGQFITDVPKVVMLSADPNGKLSLVWSQEFGSLNDTPVAYGQWPGLAFNRDGSGLFVETVSPAVGERSQVTISRLNTADGTTVGSAAIDDWTLFPELTLDSTNSRLIVLGHLNLYIIPDTVGQVAVSSVVPLTVAVRPPYLLPLIIGGAQFAITYGDFGNVSTPATIKNLFYSTDLQTGETTTVELPKELELATLRSPMVADPRNTQNIYAATANGLFKSTNGGLTWVMIANLDVEWVAVDPSSNVYAVSVGAARATSDGHGNPTKKQGEGSAPLGMIESTDGGSSFVAINNGLPPGFFGSIVIDPSNSIVFLSTSGGLFSWNGSLWAPVQTP